MQLTLLLMKGFLTQIVQIYTRINTKISANSRIILHSQKINY